ncbi:MAG: hypothetical protein ABJE79_10765 [Marinomonas sp.]
MNQVHKNNLAEIESLYDELKTYLDSCIVGAEQEGLYQRCDQLAEKLVAYDMAIIANNSKLVEQSLPELEAFLMEVKDARTSIQSDLNRLNNIASIARNLDKVLNTLAKFV